MVNKNFFLRAVALVAAHWFVLANANDACVWCDQHMAMRFMNCLFVEIISDPALDVLERELLLDTKRSLFAASLGIRSSPDPVKNKIMNGALAGELSGMISSHSAATGQRPDVATDEIMRLIGYCYFSVTEQSEVHFVNTLRREVTDIIKDTDDYKSQDDDMVFTSNQRQPLQNNNYAFGISNQPQPMPPKNVFQNNDVPKFDNNFSGWPQKANAVAAATSMSNQNFGGRPAAAVPLSNNNYASEISNQPQPIPPKNVFQNNDVPKFDNNFSGWPQKANAVATATSLSNQNFGGKPAATVPLSVPNNPNIPNHDSVVSFVNPDFDRPLTGILPNRVLPLNPLQDGKFPVSSSNQILNSPTNSAIPQIQEQTIIPPKYQDNSPFLNQNSPIQPSFLGQPNILDRQPDFLPSRNFPIPLLGQLLDNQAPSPELSLVQKPSFSIDYPLASNQGFAPFPNNKDLGNQPLPVAPNIYQNEQNSPIPKRQFPEKSILNSDFPVIPPQIREPVLPNFFPNSPGPVTFPRGDLNDQRPIAAQPQSFGNIPSNDQRPIAPQPQSFGNIPSNDQPNNQFPSVINIKNPVLRQPDYDYPSFTRENFQNYPFGIGTESFPQSNTPNENSGLPLESSYLTLNSNQQTSNVQDLFRLPITPEFQAPKAEPVGIPQPYQNGASVLDSTFKAPVDSGFNTYDTGQQETQTRQGESGIMPQTFGQNIPNNAKTDNLSSDNSKFVGMSPPEQDNTSFQPIESGNYHPGPNEDKLQNRIQAINKDSEDCATKFSETLYVHLLKTNIVHSVFGTNTLPSSVQQTVSEAIRRAFIDNSMPEYADQVAEYSSQQIGLLPESSRTQAYANKISKSVSDVLYRNNAMTENCYDAAVSMSSAITRWLEVFAFADSGTETGQMLSSDSFNPTSGNSSPNTGTVNLDENQQSKNNGAATSFSEEQDDSCDDDEEDSSKQQAQNGEADKQDEFCDDEEEDSFTQQAQNSEANKQDEFCDEEEKDSLMQQAQNGEADKQDDFCEDDGDESLKSSEGAQKSKLSDTESKSHFKTLMSAIKNSVSKDGFNYPRLTSAMSSIISSTGNKHPDWNSDEVLSRVYVETISALTLVLQEVTMSSL